MDFVTQYFLFFWSFQGFLSSKRASVLTFTEVGSHIDRTSFKIFNLWTPWTLWQNVLFFGSFQGFLAPRRARVLTFWEVGSYIDRISFKVLIFEQYGLVHKMGRNWVGGNNHWSELLVILVWPCVEFTKRGWEVLNF